ncbi:SsrA-binding protein SmpB [Candidatus Saccharibacteria bacterium]|nr:MAG: SsrA-binding protein SmpB [Candidatus Saccharibacteria bacterium]
MAKKGQQKTPSIVNRRARFDYELKDDIVAGVVLTGPEVRAIRDGRAHLKGAFVTIKGDELWLHNASLSVRLTGQGENETAVDTRARKLLAHRREIEQLEQAKQAGLTIVPLKMLTDGRFIKVVIAAAKGKKNYDKRETIKRREQERESRRQIKHS